MSQIREQILDFFFPPCCIYCGGVLDFSPTRTCLRCQKKLPWISPSEKAQKGRHYERCLSSVWYQDKARDAMLAFKFEGAQEHAPVFAEVLAQDISTAFPDPFDCITWIPVSPERLLERGYDQAYLLAKAVSERLCTPLLPTLVKAHTSAQSSLGGRNARSDNIKGAFSLLGEHRLTNARILLIDDIFTTGATLEEAAATLVSGGCAGVFCATFCRTPLAEANQPLLQEST